MNLDPIHYEGHVIRPPSESDSILLEVTVGCSHQSCTFCGAYQFDRFRIKSEAEICDTIELLARYHPDRERVFLLHGDALVAPTELLVRVLERIARRLPQVRRVSSYANPRSIALKSDHELRELRDRGLRLIHLGLESGDDTTLRAVRKGADSEFIVEQGRRLRAAGIRLFVTVILGLAGREGSTAHARATARALSLLGPDYIGALSLVLIPGTPLYHAWQSGEFAPLGPREMLEELRELLCRLELERGIFYANHASNYLPLRVRMPRDKQAALALLDAALAGRVPLRPDWLRGL